MRVVSWNVNSMKARLPRFQRWLDERDPDVVLLQETKLTDDGWPAALLAERGYASAHLGSGRWNGVAIMSRVGLAELNYGLADQPAFAELPEGRALGATCGGLRLWSVYVPNGRSIGSEHFAYKLGFLAALQAQVAADTRRLGEQTPFAVLGDFNVAPRDEDVWDITAFDDRTHVTPAERSALAEVRGDQLADLLPRASEPAADRRPPYTFWEMRMLGFQKGRGMRIDLALANAALRRRVTDVWVDRDARKGDGPSDHAPLVLDIGPAE